MPSQPLLKATLLKEAYGQLVDLNGTEKKHAVEGVSPSRLNGMERRLFDHMAPEVVPEKEFQKPRQPGWLQKTTGLQIKDLLDVYERLFGARSKNKSTNRITRLRRSVYKGFSTQPHKKVSTTKRESRNFPSDDFDFDRAGEPFSSPAESLKSHGNASLESVEAESEERNCRDWDDIEHPGEIQTPLVGQRMRYRQDEESRSTDGPRIKTEHTISGRNSSEASDCDQKSSAKSLERLSGTGQGQSAEEDSRRTGTGSRPCHSTSPSMPRTTESERNCNPVDGKMLDTVMTKAIQPSVEDSTGRGTKADFSAKRSGSVSLRDLLVQAENLEDKGSSSSRQVSHLVLLAPRRSSSTNAKDPALRTTEGDAEGGDQSLIDISRNNGEFEHLSGQEENSRKPHNDGNENDDHVNGMTRKSSSDRGMVDPRQALRPSEQPEVSENSFAKDNGRSHRRSSSLEIIFNIFGKCRFTEPAKQDCSRGCPEDSHIIENSSATSQSDLHHRPLERLSNGLEDGQSMTESTETSSADFSKDSRSDVSDGNHNSSASNPQSDTFALMERSGGRYGRSKSTNGTTAFPTATRSWSRAGPTIANATIGKVQKMLGRSASLRTTQVEQEKTKTTQHSEERRDVSRTPLRGDPSHDNSRNHSSLRQLLRDESTFVWSRGSIRSAEHSPQEEGQKFISSDDVNLNDLKKTDSVAASPLVWTFKKILCCGQCGGRIRIVTDWIDGIDWTCHTKVGKASEEEDRSVSHSDGRSPPQRSSPQKRTSCRSPRSSSTRKKMSPKRKNDHATRHTRRPSKPVRSDESNKRNLPNRIVLRQYRTDPIPSKDYPEGRNAEELTCSGAPRAAGSTGESALADMSHSGARNHTSTEQACVWDHQDNKASELWRPPSPNYRRQRRRSTGRSTPSSRFQRECLARQSTSASPTTTPENPCYPSAAAGALLDTTDQDDSESEIVHRQLECVR